MRRSVIIFFAISFLSLLNSSAAWGWGSYGHEQIQAAALQALGSSGLAACFQSNRDYLIRLSITPDYDWKMVGKTPTDPDLKAQKKKNDKYEHPLHFFEADSFINSTVTPQAIQGLPSSVDYPSVFEEYRKLLSANARTVTLIDPSKKFANPDSPTDYEVTEHGSAPWRIVQLYRLGVAALKKNDNLMGLYYLGAMGHYVGDMSQPMHASLNYDGQYWDPTARGVHHDYEESILEVVAKKAGAKHDTETGLWSNFKGTQGPIVAALKQFNQDGALTAVAPDKIVQETLNLISSGYDFIKPILGAFSYATQGVVGDFPTDRHPAAGRVAMSVVESRKWADSPAYVTEAQLRKFLSADPTDPTSDQGETTILATAQDRLARSSALLVRIWRAAIDEASSARRAIRSTKSDFCDTYDFSLEDAINNYPIPDYLPSEKAGK